MMMPYEETWQMNIEENNKKLEALNLPSLSQSLRKSSSATSKPSSFVKGRSRFVRPGDLNKANKKRLRSFGLRHAPPHVTPPPTPPRQLTTPLAPPTHVTTPPAPPTNLTTPPAADQAASPPLFSEDDFSEDDVVEDKIFEDDVVDDVVSEDDVEDVRLPKKKKAGYWDVDVIDEAGHISSTRLSVTDMFQNTCDVRRVITTWNPNHQPVGEAAGLLAGFLGEIARKFVEFPIIFENWKDISRDKKTEFYDQKIKTKFVEMTRKNATNRAKLKKNHTLGTKSIARTQEELEKRSGRKYSRGDMFGVSHKKPNGSFVNDEAKKKNDQLQAEIAKTHLENEAFVKVFGKEHGGFVRSMGLGVTPSQLTTARSPRLTSSSEDKEKMKQMQAEIDSLKDKALQVDILKEQVAFLMQKHNSNGNQQHHIPLAPPTHVTTPPAPPTNLTTPPAADQAASPPLFSEDDFSEDDVVEDKIFEDDVVDDVVSEDDVEDVRLPKKKKAGYWDVDVIDEAGHISSTRLSVTDMFQNTCDVRRVITTWNPNHQPVGEAAGLLAGFLGEIARKFVEFPIIFENWKDISRDKKTEFYDQKIKQHHIPLAPPTHVTTPPAPPTNLTTPPAADQAASPPLFSEDDFSEDDVVEDKIFEDDVVDDVVSEDDVEDVRLPKKKKAGYWDVDVIDEAGHISSTRLSVTDMFQNTCDVRRVITTWNPNHQPVGEAAGLLAGFLGEIARKFVEFPIIFENWKDISRDKKTEFYDQKIKQHHIPLAPPTHVTTPPAPPTNLTTPPAADQAASPPLFSEDDFSEDDVVEDKIFEDDVVDDVVSEDDVEDVRLPKKKKAGYWDVDVIDEAGHISSTRLSVTDMFQNTCDVRRVITTWNPNHQPVGEAAGLLAGFLGEIARKFVEFPIIFENWKDISRDKKTEFYDQKIKQHHIPLAPPTHVTTPPALPTNLTTPPAADQAASPPLFSEDDFSEDDVVEDKIFEDDVVDDVVSEDDVEDVRLPKKKKAGYWDVDVIDEAGHISSTRLSVTDMFQNTCDVRRVITTWNPNHQPVGEAAGLLAGFLGEIARKFVEFPIIFENWKDISRDKKTEFYDQKIKVSLQKN
ncbi:Asparagine-rich protein (ARP protein) [Trifolium repens]|nr:Asparagine-rich protein (ARP protein) [Trifolium repens]